MSEAISFFPVRLPAVPETVDVVHEQLKRLWEAAEHVPTSDRMAFDLAVIETVSNTIQHGVADPGPVEVEVALTAAPEELQATITEYGAACPEGAAGETGTGAEEVFAAAQELMTESGRGMALIYTLVTLAFERHGGNNVWRLRRQTSTAA